MLGGGQVQCNSFVYKNGYEVRKICENKHKLSFTAENLSSSTVHPSPSVSYHRPVINIIIVPAEFFELVPCVSRTWSYIIVPTRNSAFLSPVSLRYLNRRYFRIVLAHESATTTTYIIIIRILPVYIIIIYYHCTILHRNTFGVRICSSVRVPFYCAYYLYLFIYFFYLRSSPFQRFVILHLLYLCSYACDPRKRGKNVRDFIFRDGYTCYMFQWIVTRCSELNWILWRWNPK